MPSKHSDATMSLMKSRRLRLASGRSMMDVSVLSFTPPRISCNGKPAMAVWSTWTPRNTVDSCSGSYAAVRLGGIISAGMSSTAATPRVMILPAKRSR